MCPFLFELSKTSVDKGRPAGHKWSTKTFGMPFEIILNNKTGLGQNFFLSMIAYFYIFIKNIS